MDANHSLTGKINMPEATVAELEEEVDVVLMSFAQQELRVLDGYLIAVRPGVDVPVVAECPKLRAVAQGETEEAVLADLKDAMGFSLEYISEYGKPIPAKDVEDRCD